MGGPGIFLIVQIGFFAMDAIGHGNLRYPPKATPPRNKALLRETTG